MGLIKLTQNYNKELHKLQFPQNYIKNRIQNYIENILTQNSHACK